MCPLARRGTRVHEFECAEIDLSASSENFRCRALTKAF